VTARGFRLPDAGSPEIRITPDLLRGPSVEVGGRPVERRRDGIRIYWPVTFADGSERRLFLAGQLTGLRAVVDGREYPVEPRLPTWQLVLAVAPIGIVTLLAGVVGLLTGGLATGASFVIFRRPWPLVARLVAWAVALAVAVVAAAVGAPLVA
jgi:hypothetical protein